MHEMESLTDYTVDELKEIIAYRAGQCLVHKDDKAYWDWKNALRRANAELEGR